MINRALVRTPSDLSGKGDTELRLVPPVEASPPAHDERTAQLIRLGLLVEELGPGEILARLKGEQADPSVAVMRGWGREWVRDAQTLMQAPSTIEGKKIALDRFFWWCEFARVEHCGPSEAAQFVSYVATSHELPGGRWGRGEASVDPEFAVFQKQVSPRTVKFYRNHLKAFFNWLQSKHYVSHNPVEKVPIPRQIKPPVIPFSPDQFEDLIRAARRSQQPRRDEAIFWLMYDTGVREAELCDMRLHNLVLKERGGTVRIVGKGSKVRVVPFARRARTVLWKYLETAPKQGEDKIFVAEGGWRKGNSLSPSGLLQLYKRTGAAAGISDVRCSPHTMRHTFAIRFLRRGGDIQTLSYLLGHESINMTSKYLHIAEADAENQHQMYSPADALEF